MKRESAARTILPAVLRCVGGVVLLYLSLGLLMTESHVEDLLHNGTALMLGGFGLFLIWRGVSRYLERRGERREEPETSVYISGESHGAELLREEEEF